MNKQFSTEKKLDILRHSTAHILAAAILEMFPKAKFGIGPTIEDGFYYDFDNIKITDTDLPEIEKRMQNLIKKDLKFKKEIISFAEAKKFFKNQPYKLDLIKELQKNKKKISIYKTSDGENIVFLDLCSGPHVSSTKEINPNAFKLTKIAGAYWRGDEKNPMLIRIYGVAFETKKELDDFLKLQEEIEKRDHRKLGERLKIFTFSEEVGQGLPLWLPNGTIIREELEKWAKEIEEKEGYLRVVTPHITKNELYYISGHLPYYKNDMYAPFKIEEKEYYLKPMNCPHHHMIYKSSNHSYRDLPLRLAEYGTVYRYERSGTLYGLMRVRSFSQNDAHIYCTLKQAKDEFIKVMKLHEYYYKKLGIKKFYMELGLPDPKNKEKYHGEKKMWNLAEQITREAMKESKIPYVEKIGSAAFYGPKIDFIIETVTVKEYAISTNQLDLYMAEKFGLTYIDEKGRKQTPAIIHRAPLGSHERFIGFLIEHFAGALPLWLSPIQVKIINVGSAHRRYANFVKQQLITNNIRTNLSDENFTVSKRIREAEIQKIPYILVVGDKEVQNQSVNVRHYRRGQEGEIKVNDLIKKLKDEIEKKVI